MGWPPRASIEYTICIPVIWAGKPSTLPSTESGFTPTTSVTVLGEKLGTNPQIGQPTCYGLCRELFFSGAVALSVAIDD
jgi:hypothetical protein